MDNKYVLAMYDVRGKQDYIYRRNKLKEIIGASMIIRDVFIDYLFPMAKKVEGKGIYSYRSVESTDNEEKFTVSDLINKLERESYIGYVVYEGGGNFFVIFKSVEIYRKVNMLFYSMLLKETNTLRVLSSYIEGINFDNYIDDEKELRRIHTKAERYESAIYPINSLPIVQSDYKSSMPLTDIEIIPDSEKSKPEKVCKESHAKYNKFYKPNALDDLRKKEIKNFDDMVEKGEDSHLAVIYIDGNSMGAKVQECLDNKKTYEECVNALRDFSKSIQNDYIDEPIKRITDALNDDGNKPFRFVVYAGDEITFICKARDAYEVVNEYFDCLKANEEQSSCAGIAIFHSHTPYSEAYRIAEECCESGKKVMKERQMDVACFMDFHYCQGAIGTSIEQIRDHEGTKSMCIPWLLKENQDDSVVSKDQIEKMKKVLTIIARSNNKTLLQVSKRSQELYNQEVERIIVHYTGEKDNKDFLINNKDFIINNRDLLYRMMLVYDLWFSNQRKMG